jgi:homoserine kinase
VIFLLAFDTAKASCPSSIANVGPGFDIAAIAIAAYRDTVTVTKQRGSGKVFGGRDEAYFGNRNTAVGSVKKLIETQRITDIDLWVKVEKNVPIGVGLGSSGASAAAAVLAANQVLGLDLTKAQLVKYAAHGEALVAGSPHADNVSASLMGGLTCVFDSERDEVFSMSVPRNMTITVLIIGGFNPEDKTRRAREVLPKSVRLSLSVSQAARISRLLYAAATGNWGLFATSVSSDLIIESARSKIYPWLPKLKRRALELGASGCSLCGAGPSMFSVSFSNEHVFRSEEWLNAAKEEGLSCSVQETYVDNEGGRIEEQF